MRIGTGEKETIMTFAFGILHILGVFCHQSWAFTLWVGILQAYHTISYHLASIYFNQAIRAFISFSIHIIIGIKSTWSY